MYSHIVTPFALNSDPSMDLLAKKSAVSLPKGDRFIPCRNTSANNQANLMDCSPMEISISDSDSEGSYNSKCSECAYKALIQENLSMGAIDSKKVLHFKNTELDQVYGYRHGIGPAGELCGALHAAYVRAQQVVDEKKKAKRRVPRKAERILDAPELLDDYYLNLVDWSISNKVAVCLGHSLYVWDATTGNSTQLLTHDTENRWNVLTAVAWSPLGNDVAIGCADRSIQIWDSVAMKCKAVLGYNSHEARISALAWNHGGDQNILTSGSRDSNILHHDMRAHQKPMATLKGHTQEVCGLKWSPEGTQLASGGNDNTLCIWDIGNTVPRFSKPNYHQAAVKALAWCPWQGHLLATGGGTADKCIKFWDTLSGECIKSHQTESQICSMLFNPLEKELISSHGFTTNNITIWRYPEMDVVAELKGHKSRVLYMAMSPDGTTIVSGSADETLRFWNVNSASQTPQKASKGKKDMFGFGKNEIR